MEVVDHQYIIAIKEYLSSFFVRRGKMPFLGNQTKAIILTFFGVRKSEKEEEQHHHNVRTYGGRQNKCRI